MFCVAFGLSIEGNGDSWPSEYTVLGKGIALC